MEDNRSRDELRILNEKAWNGELFEPESQDSSMKKNSAFVKKLRTSLTRDQLKSVINDANALSLKKYHEELVISMDEGLSSCKVQDTNAAVEVVGLFHRRFCSDFTPLLLTKLLERLKTPKDDISDAEDKERISQVKCVLRVITECYDLGIFRSADDASDVPGFMAKRSSDGLLVAIMKEILSYKMNKTLSIATVFTKRFISIIEGDDALRQLMCSYTSKAVERTEELNRRIYHHDKKKFKTEIRTGKMLEEVEQRGKELNELFEVYKSAVDILCPLLKVTPPEFPEVETGEQEEDEATVLAKADGVWANEDERKFYQSFPEIPQDYIDGAKDDKGVEKGELMTEFLTKLETSSSLKEVDECVMMFWEFKLTNKASLKRLSKHITTSQELSNLKTYSRFLKSNQVFLQPFIDEVVDFLDKGFRSQIYRNGLNVRNIMFFSEMMKFDLIPQYLIFHKIRSLILSLNTPHNVDILNIFFELSGKYLLYTHTKLMNDMIKLLEDKRMDSSLSSATKMSIANLFVILRPPAVKTLQKQNTKVYTPQQLFLKHLIRNELNVRTISKVSQIIKNANLQDEKIFETLLKLLSKPEKVKYENILPLTRVTRIVPSGLKTIIIDQVLENIVRDMEINDYKFNRTRVAQCTYMAMMLNCGIIKLETLNDLLFKILTFGHPMNNPVPGVFVELDPPDDYIRITLVTCMLQELEPTKRNIDAFTLFLHFLDYYTWTKDMPLPKDTEMKLMRCYKSFQFVKGDSLVECIDKLSKAVEARNFVSEGGGVDLQIEEEEDDDDDDEEEDEDEDDDDDDDDEDDEDEEEEEEDDDDEEEEDLDELGDVVDNESVGSIEEAGSEGNEGKLSYEAYEAKLREEEELKLEQDLEREFKKMVFESMHANKADRAKIDIPQNISISSTTPPKPSNSDKVTFTLITKNDKSMGTRNLSVPMDSRIATNVANEDSRRRTEKMKLNNYILKSNYDD
ncbi:Nmd2p [Cyberlindnera jadinii NRRL Y-1542]|uniref:ARM repeat-containing protein n=1 Tax=Cyberlindnera jadinii (strain ATCC 18201 / CBS 1600 / BCRC 20928 / JCM 3617 / NBRC 0987 / NRRL Y-1542) TaxID=983966 RepID=A0A1E4RYS3_CYBJN|nr:ARM repeat-containing protein [Cyberlindnera jadinii NRRL Y-1542]ODV72424.1 ARM repeat-containing protein [Cyberlindnera jadinii NRRL Y-1542]